MPEFHDAQQQGEAAQPFKVLQPAAQTVPFVFNAPHSGRDYPPDFLAAIRLDRHTVRKSEDFLVDRIFEPVIELGAPLLVANFPRAYLDVNREPYELDPRMFDGPLPAFANTRSLRVAGGLGTIARIVSETEEIYAHRLDVGEVMSRIERLYKPYHGALRHLLARTHVAFGHAVLVDCHSMPSTRDGALHRARPDFILGDRYGTSCAQQIVWAAYEFLNELGYDVEINKPYAGGFITEHYGRPDNGIHALQIEINRGLYMNESTLETTGNYETLVEDITAFVTRFLTIPSAGLSGSQPLAAE
ncbi:MAG: N-formylglutamate amidohydrolase [Nitratireductor sp.]|nr:N-formylglutamate amidohydrolase [Nitratireductor sp.]